MSELTLEEMREKAKQELVSIEQTASVNVYGNSAMISGMAIDIYDTYTGLNQKFYIDQDIHKFENGQHTVELTINYKNIMNDVDASEKADDTTNGDSSGDTSGSGQGAYTNGVTIKGKFYSTVWKFPGSVITNYGGGGSGASGMGLINGKTCAAHNMPYGTKIYIPKLENEAGGGIFTVTDTGGCFFDFDIYTKTHIGKVNFDVYVLSWGTGKVAWSFTEAMNWYSASAWNRLKSAWTKYKNMGGCTVNLWKFKDHDKNIKNNPRA